MDHRLVLWLALAGAGLFLRAAVSLHSYSGQGTPPKYGDFEAQRHWQEITVNLPPTEWYRNTTDNDLLYWGLDYPPLTAYHSYLVGQWARWRGKEEFVALHESRGISTDEHKHFMRNTVLLIDAILYVPAILLALHYVPGTGATPSSSSTSWLPLALAVLYPGQMLIDNGHFQYNNVSLALFVLAALAIASSKAILSGAVLFCLALNYKQMELYHALPFFFQLLWHCFESDPVNRLVTGIKRLVVLGVTVIGTFAIVWLPWLGSVEDVGQLVHRIFPVSRGLFEDKVSNFWCVVDVAIKLKNIPINTMGIVCLVCTVMAVLPSGLNLLFRKSYDASAFLYSLTVTALGFFLFSFHVHEKSILLVAIPALLLLHLEPFAVFWFLQVSSFSMFPLLYKDGLTGPYFALSLVTLILPRLAAASGNREKVEVPTYDLFHVHHLIGNSVKGSRIASLLLPLFYLSLLGQMALLSAFLFAEPPVALPFLYPLAISAYSFGHFVLFFVYFNIQQLVCGDRKEDKATIKPQTKSEKNRKIK
ncbi:probable dolichyl pyrophosphate Man9GlcNAc2 alpha-1,3-glucosyltransferase [Anopheles aquasalis]|uniref:probable dolichyl pyrophosphate Man9GlcNAc2 alpha-1,3-glucosyltransferase n=1 Tax=Anopheles aquasalis TaxID=42839 RepID=UPI00215A171F|nr:probable dolichyl pyrophosphate Man9GlcNAc2 alpha-1,3-glucosyltransferase [Anopheles aquasalis]